ncbi:MAG: hypothetical protein AAF717_04085 [Bacteroidota bacterium]
MKKLIVAIVLLGCGVLTVAATIPVSGNEIVKVEVDQDFKEISVSDLPGAVSEAFARDYAGGTINKAYVNDAGQYKLEVSLEDGSSGSLYADAEGNWINL